MDPFTIGVIAAAVAAIKVRGDRRREAELRLMKWDANLRPYRGAPGERIKIPPTVISALKVLQGDSCVYRSGDCSESLTVDHDVPLHAGGNNYSNNLQLACSRHNSSKQHRTHLEYKYRSRK